jgi:hypothetical protein
MDLKKLNSATKYPSILTYHEMGDRGRLSPTVQVPFAPGETVYVTEKVDGTNGRIVLLPESRPISHGTDRTFLIGSREEFLYAEGDLLRSPEYGIVDTLLPIAKDLVNGKSDVILVFFFEVYGGDLPAAKQYTAKKEIGVRSFDVARVPMEVLEQPVEKIAHWRDHGGQEFLTEKALDDEILFLNGYLSNLSKDAPKVERVPRLPLVQPLPTGVEATYEWLKVYENSRVGLTDGKGRSEGVVVRSMDRKAIAKIRFEDYERTLGVKRK